MPTGPLGFPRLSTIFPFVEEDSEQRVETFVTRGQSLPESGVARQLFESGEIDTTRGTEVEIVLELEGSNIIGGDVVSRSNYYKVQGVPIAITGLTSTTEKFRRKGLARRMKEVQHSDMKDRGVEVVYSVAGSEEGRSLLESMGYRNDIGFFDDDEDIYQLDL